MTKILDWVTKEITQGPAFQHLTHLKGDFNKMCALKQSTDAPETVEMITLIEALASVDADADAGIDFTVASVAVRTTFRGCSLYASFLENKVRRGLAKGSLDKWKNEDGIVEVLPELSDFANGLERHHADCIQAVR